MAETTVRKIDSLAEWRDEHQEKHESEAFRDARTRVDVQKTRVLAEEMAPKIEYLERGFESHDTLIREVLADTHEIKDTLALGPHRGRLPSLSEYAPTEHADGSVSLPPGALDSMKQAVANQRAEVGSPRGAMSRRRRTSSRSRRPGDRRPKRHSCNSGPTRRRTRKNARRPRKRRRTAGSRESKSGSQSLLPW